MQESLANPLRATLNEQVSERLVRQARLPGQLLPSRSTFSPPSHDLRFGVGIHETTFRVNVRWVTPLGEETASMS